MMNTNYWNSSAGKDRRFPFVRADRKLSLSLVCRGKFGEVKKCRERSTKHLLAAKFIQIHKEQDRIEACNEIEIMKALQVSLIPLCEPTG